MDIKHIIVVIVGFIIIYILIENNVKYEIILTVLTGFVLGIIYMLSNEQPNNIKSGGLDSETPKTFEVGAMMLFPAFLYSVAAPIGNGAISMMATNHTFLYHTGYMAMKSHTLAHALGDIHFFFSLKLIGLLINVILPIIAIGGIIGLILHFTGIMPPELYKYFDYKYYIGNAEDNYETKLFKIYNEQSKGLDYIPALIKEQFKAHNYELNYFTIGFNGNGELEYNKLMEEYGGHDMNNHFKLFEENKVHMNDWFYNKNNEISSALLECLYSNEKEESCKVFEKLVNMGVGLNKRLCIGEIKKVLPNIVIETIKLERYDILEKIQQVKDVVRLAATDEEGNIAFMYLLNKMDKENNDNNKTEELINIWYKLHDINLLTYKNNNNVSVKALLEKYKDKFDDYDNLLLNMEKHDVATKGFIANAINEISKTFTLPAYMKDNFDKVNNYIFESYNKGKAYLMDTYNSSINMTNSISDYFVNTRKSIFGRDEN